MLGQQGDGFSVGFCHKRHAGFGEFFAQLAEVLDNAVVHDRHATCTVGVSIGFSWRTVRGPTRVANARFARKRLMHQQIAEVHKFAHCAPARQFTFVYGRDTCTVIAAIFETLKRLYQDRSCFMIS